MLQDRPLRSTRLGSIDRARLSRGRPIVTGRAALTLLLAVLLSCANWSIGPLVGMVEAQQLGRSGLEALTPGRIAPLPGASLNLSIPVDRSSAATAASIQYGSNSTVQQQITVQVTGEDTTAESTAELASKATTASNPATSVTASPVSQSAPEASVTASDRPQRLPGSQNPLRLSGQRINELRETLPDSTESAASGEQVTSARSAEPHDRIAQQNTSSANGPAASSESTDGSTTGESVPEEPVFQSGNGAGSKPEADTHSTSTGVIPMQVITPPQQAIVVAPQQQYIAYPGTPQQQYIGYPGAAQQQYIPGWDASTGLTLGAGVHPDLMPYGGQLGVYAQADGGCPPNGVNGPHMGFAGLRQGLRERQPVRQLIRGVLSDTATYASYLNFLDVPKSSNRGIGGPFRDNSGWDKRPYYIGWFVGPVWGGQLIDDWVGGEKGYLGGFRLGWDYNHYWGLEARLGYASITTKDSASAIAMQQRQDAIDFPTMSPDDPYMHRFDYRRDNQLSMFDVSLLYYPLGNARWRPYLSLGIGTSRSKFSDRMGVYYSVKACVIPIAVGVKYLYNDRVDFRLDLANNLTLGHNQVSPHNDLSLTFGMAFRFGGKGSWLSMGGGGGTKYWPYNPGINSSL